MGTHLFYWLIMATYYVFTTSIIFKHNHTDMYPLFAVTVFLNILVQILLIVLGRTNPGIIPKI
jgi:hypothetical protein